MMFTQYSDLYCWLDTYMYNVCIFLNKTVPHQKRKCCNNHSTIYALLKYWISGDSKAGTYYNRTRDNMIILPQQLNTFQKRPSNISSRASWFMPHISQVMNRVLTVVVKNGCFSASVTVIRFSGSTTKHLRMRSLGSSAKSKHIYRNDIKYA